MKNEKEIARIEVTMHEKNGREARREYKSIRDRHGSSTATRRSYGGSGRGPEPPRGGGSNCLHNRRIERLKNT